MIAQKGCACQEPAFQFITQHTRTVGILYRSPTILEIKTLKTFDLGIRRIHKAFLNGTLVFHLKLHSQQDARRAECCQEDTFGFNDGDSQTWKELQLNLYPSVSIFPAVQ